jgi:protein O-mannosyl-transferase
MRQILDRLNMLTTWQAAIIIAAVGLIVFATGFNTPFIGDDQLQIENNPVAHSITNLPIFFEGGTFYTGQGNAPLTGTYYRPLMMTAYALIYTIFGPNTFAFHTLQILICIASALLLYLVFRRFFTALPALVLSLIFLVHPLNSQVVFAIPTLQDALFFFFGILALWLIIRFDTTWCLCLTALCLFLSLLSKETGVLFIAMIAIYLFIYDRERIRAFIGYVSIPVVIYLILYANAIGFFTPHSVIAPIDSLGIVGRMLTAPSILLFYIAKFILPLQLASGYYWTYPSFSFQNVLLPLLIVTSVVAAAVYIGILVRKKLSEEMFHAYLFFSTWAVLGLLIHLQIIPLDFTVSESWFYFPMAGILGMIGITLILFQDRLNAKLFLVVSALIVLALGARTSIRGTDWSSSYNLAVHDIAVSKDDYVAYSVLASNQENQGDFSDAKANALKSISIQPYFTNYANLAIALTGLKDYPGAVKAYESGLKYAQPGQIYENLAWLTLVYGDYNTDKPLILSGLQKYPKDPTLWVYLAVLEQRYGSKVDAKADIAKAATYGQVAQFQGIYNGIAYDQPFNITLDSSGNTLEVQ